MAHIEVHTRTQAEYEYARKKRASEMRMQLTSFAIMIFLTLISFTAVMADFSPHVVAPAILILAAVQVALQFYQFMHMKEKGHGVVQFFLYAGILIAFITILAFVTIVWW